MQISKNIVKYTLALLSAMVLFNSCKKEYESIESIDDAKIKAYIQQNNLPAIKDASGYYYQVLDKGTGAPLLNKDSVFYSLTVKSLSGVSYYTPLTYSNEGNYLGYLTPESYRTALYSVNRGGKVRVLVPSYLAYGKNGLGSIPPNEVLVTEITVYPETTQWQIDDRLIKQFMVTKGLTMINDPSRVYYSVAQAGTGETIDLSSKITVKYTGRFLSGTIFDQTTGDATISQQLNGFVSGWRKVMVGMKKGAKIRMLIPSDLAYGSVDKINQNTGVVSIPKNSVLDFDVEVTDVTN